MPINRGAGRAGNQGRGVLAIPGLRLSSTLVGRTGPRGRPFRSRPFSTTSVSITGVTRDSTGAVLASCVVQLFRTVDDAIQLETASDGSGAFVFYPGVGGPFYLVAYKAGAPDLAGTTVNTVQPNA